METNADVVSGVLNAYRSDLFRARVEQFTDDDASWILAATGLERLAQLGRVRSEQHAVALGQSLRRYCSSCRDDDVTSAEAPWIRAVADALLRASAIDDRGVWVQPILALVERIELSGALVLAQELLLVLKRLVRHPSPEQRGLMLLERGRIRRTLGDLDGSLRLCSDAESLAERHALHAIRCRAIVAQGSVALVRGNYPDARVLFTHALQVATKHGVRASAALAHQGLMVAAGVAGDLAAALSHGWAAFREATAAEAEGGPSAADHLVNLAQWCLEAGYPEAALRANLHALELYAMPRIRLPALSGVAVSASRLGLAAIVDRAADAIAHSVSDAFPYESARAWTALAQSLLALGRNEQATAARTRARQLARAGGFFEVLYDVEEKFDRLVAASAPRDLSRESQRIVEHIEGLDADVDVLTSLSGTPTG